MVTIILTAVVIGLIAGVVWISQRGYLLGATTLLWLLYAGYETWVQKTCTGECNIRVDLVLIYPLLLVMTLLSIGSLILRAVRRRGRPSP